MAQGTTATGDMEQVYSEQEREYVPPAPGEPGSSSAITPWRGEENEPEEAKAKRRTATAADKPADKK